MTRKKANTSDLLVLECFEDDLSDAQMQDYKKVEQELSEFKKKLESLTQGNRNISSHSTIVQPASNDNQPSLLLQTTQPQHNNIMLLEQNGMHLVMNNVQSPQTPTTLVAKTSAIRLPPPTTATSRSPRILTQPKITVNNNLRPKTAAPTVSSPTFAKLPLPSAPTIVTASGVTRFQLKAGTSEVTSPVTTTVQAKAKTGTSSSNDIVDLTDDVDHDPDSTADQNEVTIGKVAEKTFPSLVVNVRGYLRMKEILPAVVTQERANLDARVKKTLMLSPSAFTEWLLQQGLLKCEQVCSQHRGANGRFTSLKLGMYSDTTKFPYSGGYVWISECCPTTFVSVFAGSLFEGAPFPPTVLLKLMYHWACQTVVQNVLQWVKVDNLYLKTMYTNLRAVCTAAVHEHYGKLGGPNKKVEVGVISLGTTTQDGHMKHIKVEVLGVLETETKKLRLKALEPIADNDRQFLKKKFMKILEPLQQWVDKDSIIITDYTVDRTTCHKMGFANIIQNSHGTPTTPDQPTNQTIMDYLRKVIPKMFQNTLSLLSRQIIQQFLDELVWRETWGPISARAFDSIVLHLSEQTRIDSGGSLMHRLARISANPLKNWKYDKWASNCKVNSAVKTNKPPGQGEGNDATPSTKSQLERALLNSSANGSASASPSSGTVSQTLEAAMIALEPYYYGTLAGDVRLTTEKFVCVFRCVMCKDEFRYVAKFTEHLISHAFNKNVRDNVDTKELCKLCLKICPKTNNQNLTTHRNQVHADRQTCRTLCKICSVKHKDAGSLQSHMISSHCELDMPYHCDICNFRTSILDSIHHHFTNAHSKGTKGYCPYCLKVFQFATIDGVNLDNNQLSFVLHIQKHQLTVNRKCEKCLLNFTNRSILKEHQDVWHQSCKFMEDVERFTMDECTLMAAPLIDPLPSSTASIESTYRGTLKFGFDTSNKYCLECDGLITHDHFVGHLMCSKCRFQTCCNHSMKEHNALVHGTSLLHLRPPIIGRAPIQNFTIYCVCDYSTRNGSYMASHLVECSLNQEKRCFFNKRPIKMVEIKTEDESTSLNNNKRRKYEDGY
ncbi:hypothetical protein O3M35_013022 [Rhynocoris fuscipes]|uniref:C2H2-type domain-containing protein n=1 Tax=Rhynocoris fuscipes TaxID=488301 RepID=A0AAW1CEZ5_9HEMI